MTIIRRTNPLGELVSLRNAMDRLFDDSFVRPRFGAASDDFQLALDIRTTADAIVVEAALPGIRPEDVDISVLGDTLTINASHRDEQSRDQDGYSYREIRRGSFNRTITLPGGVRTEDASATFENGLLTLSFPKAEEAKPRQIRISPGAGAGVAQSGTSEQSDVQSPASYDQSHTQQQATEQGA